MNSRATRLWSEVHRIARAYHWGEREILSLPLSRRATYLAFIDADADAGLFTALDGGHA